jgi:hypothetical protein
MSRAVMDTAGWHRELIWQNEGVVKENFATVLKIQKALEKAGVLFTDDEAGEIGVRLQKGKRRMKARPNQPASPRVTGALDRCVNR